MIRYFSQALLVFAFLGCFLFVLTYQLVSRWWRSDVGINQMAFAASETVVLGLSLLTMLFGDFPGRQVVGLAAFFAFTVVAWWRWTVLLKVQVAERQPTSEDRI